VRKGEINADGTTDPSDDNHVTLPAGSLNEPVTVSELTFKNSGTAALNITAVTGLEGLVTCDTQTPITADQLKTLLGLPHRLGPGDSVTFSDIGCVLVTCPGAS